MHRTSHMSLFSEADVKYNRVPLLVQTPHGQRHGNPHVHTQLLGHSETPKKEGTDFVVQQSHPTLNVLNKLTGFTSMQGSWMSPQDPSCLSQVCVSAILCITCLQTHFLQPCVNLAVCFSVLPQQLVMNLSPSSIREPLHRRFCLILFIFGRQSKLVVKNMESGVGGFE